MLSASPLGAQGSSIESMRKCILASWWLPRLLWLHLAPVWALQKEFATQPFIIVKSGAIDASGL